MFPLRKSASRRADVRRKRPDTLACRLRELRNSQVLPSVLIGVLFGLAVFFILLMREQTVPYRPGQWVHHPIVSRVNFTYHDESRLAEARRQARQQQPRVYRAVPEAWDNVQRLLINLPSRVAGLTMSELSEDLRHILDSGALAKLQEYHSGEGRRQYEQAVRRYVQSLRELNLIILPEAQRREDADREIVIPNLPQPVPTHQTYSLKMREDLAARFNRYAVENFLLVLQPKIVALTLEALQPTYVYDEQATTEARNIAEQMVGRDRGDIVYVAKQELVPGGQVISHEQWKLLRAENQAFLEMVGRDRWSHRLGLLGIVIMLTAVLGIYIAQFQPRVLRNHARAAAIAVLLASMLLMAQLAAVGSTPWYLFGVAPTILVAMILAIAYDRRFALGIAAIHSIMVALALGSNLEILLILLAGAATACIMLDEVRTRSKLIEVGGATALAMIFATGAIGATRYDPIQLIANNCLYVGAAGLGVGFVVLGILPFIEKAFRITTSMTLLELADNSHPLLRRLAMEAPGTYAHSLQVATLAEEAADAIGANALACRVGAYYHDIGKIHKADYFVENQQPGENRHLNLSPNVSLLIIIGHVKDGVELAKEYNLPTSLFPFIQQHHGTTLVEYFYHQACSRHAPEGQQVPEEQYRYPGPRPRTKETAILMLADAVESATRSMTEPTASRIEALVHEITMRRLTDGQFDECDITLKDLDRIGRSMIKTLLGIYHGRIAYPSTAAIAQGAVPPQANGTKVAGA